LSTLTSKDINTIVVELSQYARKYDPLINDVELSWKTLVNYDQKYLIAERDYYADQAVYNDVLGPVKFVRLFLLEKILNNQSIGDIDQEIGIIEKTVSIEKDSKDFQKKMNFFSAFLKKYPNYQVAIEDFSTLESFGKWGTWSILFQLHFDRDKRIIWEKLENLGQYLKQKMPDPDKFRIKKNDFVGNQKFGKADAWIAFVPMEFKDHRYTYHPCIGIYPDHVAYGIWPGVKLDVDSSYNQQSVYTKVPIAAFDVEAAAQYLKDKYPECVRLNQLLKTPNTASITAVPKTPLQLPEYDKNTILYGPPGTGKTIIAKKMAVELVQKALSKDILTKKDWKDINDKFKKFQSEKSIRFVSFHQSYSYEEFIQGYRYEGEEVVVKDGLLKSFVEKILKPENKDKNFVLVIDEINRGNIAKIFGEIITIIEDNKRKGRDEELGVYLAYQDIEKQKDLFYLPNNLYFIGTMNTADRSIALIDIALRRRFIFVPVYPNPKIIENDLKTIVSDQNDDETVEFKEEDIDKIVKIFSNLNKRIEVLIDRDHTIGHSYFLNLKNSAMLYELWYKKIIPLLQEYFYNDWDKLKLVLGEYKMGTDTSKAFGFIRSLKDEYKNVFGSKHEELTYPCKIDEHEKEKDSFLTILENTFIPEED
jgi:5-methylcytosine-specific restriction protein B